MKISISTWKKGQHELTRLWRSACVRSSKDFCRSSTAGHGSPDLAKSWSVVKTWRCFWWCKHQRWWESKHSWMSFLCHKMAILWQWISNSIYFFESETFWRWNPRCSHCSLENWSGHQFIRSPNHDQSELTKDMRLSIVMGVLQNGWFIFGKIPLKWMITGGTPIYPYFRKHPNKSK